MKIISALLFVIAMIVSSDKILGAGERWFADLECGLAWSGYNDVQIPRSSGTLFSLQDDLQTKSRLIFRLRLGYSIAPRHELSLLFAPLSLKAAGRITTPLSFFNTEFAPGDDLKGIYRFNSWRLTYRYRFVDKPRWQVWIGFTAKIRDAEIRIESAEKSSSKANVGFVPLFNFSILWKFYRQYGLLLEGDAMAAPGGQGRAEDIFLGLTWKFSKKVSFKAGYRIVEGGADVEEVYNFALINYLLCGVSLRF